MSTGQNSKLTTNKNRSKSHSSFVALKPLLSTISKPHQQARAKSTDTKTKSVVEEEVDSGSSGPSSNDSATAKESRRSSNESTTTKDSIISDSNIESVSKEDSIMQQIPEVYKKQGSDYPMCGGYAESTCLCGSSAKGAVSPRLGRRLSYMDRKNLITSDRLLELRKRASDASKHHRTFTIRGCFYSIRRGLLQRGWVEKLDIHRRCPTMGQCHLVLDEVNQNLPERKPGESKRRHLTKCERNVMSRFLEQIPIDFLWSARKERSDWIDMARNPTMTINKFHKSPFTTKGGLCSVLREFHWFFEEGKSEMYYPRSYNVWTADDLGDFVDDFRLSACIAVLRCVSEMVAAQGLASVTSDKGKVPLSCIHFAIGQCKEYIRSRMHYDIDEEEPQPVWEHEWEIFLIQHRMLTHEKAHFKVKSICDSSDDGLTEPIETTVLRVEQILAEVAVHRTQYHLDGIYNIWIVKPSNRCRGRGIHLMNDLKKILTLATPPIVSKGHFVVQKYIGKYFSI